MTKQEEIKEQLRDLPFKQQVALFILLSNIYKDRDAKKAFLSSAFAEYMKKYFDENGDEYGKMIGGILSSLSRNGFIERVSGGRDPLWRPKEDIIKHADKYKKAIFEIKTFWPDTK